MTLRTKKLSGKPVREMRSTVMALVRRNCCRLSELMLLDSWAELQPVLLGLAARDRGDGI